MEAFICSRLDVVSSTEAACSLVPWLRFCATELTWVAAEASALDTFLTWASVTASRFDMATKASSILPVSSDVAISMLGDRFPCAISSATRTASSSGRITALVSRRDSTIMGIRQIKVATTMMPKAWFWALRVSSKALLIAALSRVLFASSLPLIALYLLRMTPSDAVRSSPPVPTIMRSVVCRAVV